LRHHDHNLFLQTIHELGAIGAALLAVAGLVVVLLIPRLPPGAQPFATATFAAFALVGAFAWGMWQTWFMCAVGLLPLYLLVAACAKAEPHTREHALAEAVTPASVHSPAE
jgi:O-antigen ligase